MNIEDYISLHDDDIKFAINEYVCAGSINRCIKLLHQNDEMCKELYTAVFNGLEMTAYPSDGQVYEFKYGDIVWYYDPQYKPGTLHKHRVWLLKCIDAKTEESPAKAFNEPDKFGQPSFERYGWADLNYYVDPFDPKFGLVERMQAYVSDLLKLHAESSQHKFGKLIGDVHSPDCYNKKLLSRSLNNIDGDRNQVFFPYQTGHFTTKSIVNGTYRAWDCGILEFDLVFKLGYQTTDGIYDILSCNDVRLQQSSTGIAADDNYQENAKYFYSPASDVKMFMNDKFDDIYESKVGLIKQGNRNNFVNTYFAQLDLFDTPMKMNGTSINSFADLNYMVFSSSTLAQDRNSNVKDRAISQSSNVLTWCNKTKKGIMAILITYPSAGQEDFGKNAGLAANSFSCHVIGKWK